MLPRPTPTTLRPSTRPDALRLPFNPGRRWVNLQQIVRLQSEGNYTQFFFADGSRLMVALTIKRFLTRLPPDQFVRPHRKHVINWAFVDHIRLKDSVVILTTGDEISIARRRVASLKRELRSTKN